MVGVQHGFCGVLSLDHEAEKPGRQGSRQDDAPDAVAMGRTGGSAYALAYVRGHDGGEHER